MSIVEPEIRVIAEKDQLRPTPQRSKTDSPPQAPSRQTGEVPSKLSLDGMSLSASPSMTDDTLQMQPSPIEPSSESSSPANEAKSGSKENDDNEGTVTPPSSQGDSNGELQRRQDEEDESIALARMLMAQEAMESYALSADYLRYHEDAYSAEDLAALQAAMAEEEEDVPEVSSDQDLSYDAMLRLGERIGDVKQERWSFVAKDHIAKLSKFKFDPSSVKGKDENDSNVKCLVCQCPYEDAECLRRLPCGHCFHTECVDQWLLRTDICPYCRQTIQDSA